MNLCEIKWVDAAGNPTPDTNPAIGRVRLPARVEQHHGRAITFAASRWFFICACHAEQLRKPGMGAWVFEEVQP
jgi:hypothetical protein